MVPLVAAEPSDKQVPRKPIAETQAATRYPWWRVSLTGAPLAFLLASTAIVYGLLVVFSGARQPKWAWRGAVAGLGIMTAAWIVAAPRDNAAVSADFGLWRMLLLSTEAIAIGLTIVAIAHAVLFRTELPRRARPVLVTYALYSLAQVFSTLVVEPEAWSRSLVVVPLLLLAAPYLVRDTEGTVVTSFSTVVLLFVSGSVFLLLLAPEWSVAGPTTTGLTPLPLRLQGIANHPNGLGGLAALGVALAVWPGPPRWLRLCLTLMSLSALFLSESKTAWVSASAVLILWGFFRMAGRGRIGYRAAIGASLIAVVALGVLISFSYDESWLDAPQFVTASTLTGRTALWELSLELWRDSPILGYGAVAWGLEWRERYGLSFAGQAHNQVIQTLVSSGVIGLVALISYAVALARAAFSKALATSGASIAVLAVFFLRGLTEAPMRNPVIDESLLIHLIVMGVLVSGSTRAVSARHPASVPSSTPAKS